SIHMRLIVAASLVYPSTLSPTDMTNCESTMANAFSIRPGYAMPVRSPNTVKLNLPPWVADGVAVHGFGSPSGTSLVNTDVPLCAKRFRNRIENDSTIAMAKRRMVASCQIKTSGGVRIGSAWVDSLVSERCGRNLQR